jgi:type IV pilus assembly protein PilE
MVVTMVIAILAAIAIPNYTQYVQRARRTEGKAALLRVQGALERYYTVNNAYSSNLSLLNIGTQCAGNSIASADSCTGSAYLIYIGTGPSGDTLTSYTLDAVPLVADATCGNLTLDSTNAKGSSGTGATATCWQ